MSEDESQHHATSIPAVELAKLRDAVSARYGLKLRPGEAMTIDASRAPDTAWARIEISTIDDSFDLVVECAALKSDVLDGDTWSETAALTDVLDLLDAQLDEFFENERLAHFHDDWRLYEFEGTQLRFRGRSGRPNLEALADQWLATYGGPDDDGDLN